ncbi:tripartite tricarboxylate transporter substrate binding protein [Alcaligenes sp. DN25]|uniref:Bug family tripartite tricarboxylate transporter substrate binding protein n=1 Tax=Alcaligenes TaxID=507 RepID=UPI00202DEC58|nr:MULTISPECIES: tripartite tricarboxylate transporter substrate binding protein [Alcaligenes]URW83157.1 tripartite tricarboxylate transporter substrate binding protein [Alcaligenes sp. DN25]WEA67987.1 tripartite tricarboxylate transporter substrate binding protein [Alcaligenes faecalis]
MTTSIRFVSVHRRMVMAACAAFATLATASSLHAQPANSYPQKPITIVVPFSPGGPFDLIARALSSPLAKELGQPVIVENAPGASGMIGTAKVARAQPDGYTLLLGSSGTQALNPNVFQKVPYRSPQDFVAISELASIPSILMVPVNSRFRSVEELVQHIRQNPENVTLGNAGAGSVSNQAALTFLGSFGGKVTPVPYKGTAPAMVDLIGGQIDALFDAAIQALPQIKSGKVRALAVTSFDRIQSLPNVPTLAQSCCKNAELMIWYGLLAPTGLPTEIQEILQKAVMKARADQSFIRAMQSGEAQLPQANAGSVEFADKISADVKRLADLVRVTGFKKQ